MPGQPWPKAFERVFDLIVSLAYVAGATKRIRLGTSVLIMPYYTPILLAKQVAGLTELFLEANFSPGAEVGTVLAHLDALASTR